MSLDLLKGYGVPIDKQLFTWREIAGQNPISKLNDDAFSRVRIILMNGLEMEANRFQHFLARIYPGLQVPLARIRRSETHQQATINWLLGADHSALETTIGYEQVAIEITAAIAQQEPDPYLAQVYRFGLLEDFDHLYRFAALMDRVEGKDANNILQCYTDVLPGRPTADEHRAPEDDVRRSYDKTKAAFLTKLNALTIMAGEQQTQNYYMNIGPQFTDPVARMLYAEIASIEEQHVTQYESIIDVSETFLEKWLLHEACEVYNYYSCVEAETNPRLKALWERFLDYELGHLTLVAELYKNLEGRDPAEIIPEKLPEPLTYASQRSFVREVLKNEVNLRTDGPDFVAKDEESAKSLAYRRHMNSQGSASQAVAGGYVFKPGTELAERSAAEKLRPSATHPSPLQQQAQQNNRKKSPKSAGPHEEGAA